MHLCERPLNMSRVACCQLVLMLNDSLNIPQCEPSWLLLTDDDDDRRNRSRPSWVLIEEPEHPSSGDEPLVFCLGVGLLLLVALAATLTLNRITRPKPGEEPAGYNIMMWMPSQTGSRRSSRRSSLLVMLRSVSSCRSMHSAPAATRMRASSSRASSSNRASNALSIVSDLSLPTYHSATSSVQGSHYSLPPIAPPPPYSASSEFRPDDRLLPEA